MSKLIEEHLRRLQDATARVEAAAQHSCENVVRLKKEKEELTQKYWSRGKKVSLLSETTETAAALREENAALRERLRQAQELAARLRALARALKEGANT